MLIELIEQLPISETKQCGSLVFKSSVLNIFIFYSL